MRTLYSLLLILLLSSVPLLSQAQSDGEACTGAGCCCNVQAGGKWPDCSEGFECRGMPTPPYISVCVKKGSPPQAPLSLASSQPAECKRPDDSDSEEKSTPAAAGAKNCHGAGCCCLDQALGQWPDCDAGYECRQATQKPYYKVCVKKGAAANAPLQIASSQPAQCFQRYEGGTKAKPGKGNPICENQPNPQAREWCYQHLIHPPNIPGSGK